MNNLIRSALFSTDFTNFAIVQSHATIVFFPMLHVSRVEPLVKCSSRVNDDETRREGRFRRTLRSWRVPATDQTALDKWMSISIDARVTLNAIQGTISLVGANGERENGDDWRRLANIRISGKLKSLFPISCRLTFHLSVVISYV